MLGTALEFGIAVQLGFYSLLLGYLVKKVPVTKTIGFLLLVLLTEVGYGSPYVASTLAASLGVATSDLRELLDRSGDPSAAVNSP